MNAASEQELRRPPGPRGYPVVGVLPRIWRDPLRFFEEVARDQGPVACVGLGKFTLYLLSHPDAIQYVLQDNAQNYWKGAGIEMIKPVMGDGLAVVEGDAWRRQRRLMQPSFGRKRLGELLPTLKGCVDSALDGWGAYAQAGEPFDVAVEMSRLVQATIYRAMFGGDLGDRTGPLGDALVEVNAYVGNIVWSMLPDWLPSRRRRRFQRAMKLLDEAVFGLIRSRRASGQVEGSDLLSRLLAARDPETGEGMSDRQVRDQVMTLFVAGHDTTASAAAWTLAQLALHPAVRDEVRAEAERLPAVPTADDLAALDVTGRALKETMRLYPPGWLMVRTPYEDDEVLGFHVPKDAPLLFSQWVMHRHPDLWSEPLRFDPDRFLPARSVGRHRYAYFPFGGGQRLCIGYSFAELIIHLAVAEATRRYDLSLVPGKRLEPQALTTLRPKHGVWMTCV